jgi:hypothetical protein
MELGESMTCTPSMIVDQALDLLVTKLRALSLDQLTADARTRTAVRSLMRRWARKGAVASRIEFMQPILKLTAPTVRWCPGDEPPDFGRAAWQFRTRWGQPPQRTIVYWAAEKVRRLKSVALWGRPPRPAEMRHDCHVAEVYRTLVSARPEQASVWVPEDDFARHGLAMLFEERIPDALIAASPPLAIEFGGSYRAEKLVSFHRAMAARQVPYEIW